MPFDYSFVKDNNILSEADKERMVCILLNATVGAGELPIDWEAASKAFKSASARSFKQSFTDSLKKITKAGGGSYEASASQDTTSSAPPEGNGGGAAEPVTPVKKKATPRKRKTKADADAEGAEEGERTPVKKKATPRKKKGEEMKFKSEAIVKDEDDEDGKEEGTEGKEDVVPSLFGDGRSQIQETQE